MPRLDRMSVTERLTKLEQQRQVIAQEEEILAEKRHQELVKIVVKYNAQLLDDQLFIGFLLFATAAENSDDPALARYRDLANAYGIGQNGKRLYNKKAPH